jgi:polyisoprenoid-binding protein YceI
VTESPLLPAPRAAVAGATDVQTQSAPAASAAPAPPGIVAFKVVPQESKAIFRVREQLAGRNLPNDAVGTTGAVEGQIQLGADGSIGGDSKIVVNVAQLVTDSAQRDTFIKRSTLQTSQFPTAEFVPTRAEGLPSPLPEAGEHTFRLIGLLTIHGAQQEVAWQTTASRQGERLTGKAETTVSFGDFGMEPPRAPAVLSVVDEIRLELNLVATQTA